MKRQIQYRPLAMRVLAVAVISHAGEVAQEQLGEGKLGFWAAYIDAVPGQRHDDEYEEVADHGDKLPQDVAELLFPAIAKKYVWNN